MLPSELDELLSSDRSLIGKNTIIGLACKEGKLSWLDNLYLEDVTILEKVWFYLNNVKTKPKCKICHKDTKFLGLSRGYRDTCSVSCARKYSYQERGECIKQKAKQTLQSKYGVTSQFELDSSRLAHKLAMEHRRGVKQTPEHREAIKQGMIQRYGVENPGQSKEIRERVTNTMIDRYGGYYISSLDLQQKRRSDWIKRKLSLLSEVYSTELLEEFKDTKQLHRARCLTCSTEFEIKLADGQVSRCPKCFFMPANRSIKEAEFSRFIESLGLTVLTNVKSKELIYPYSLDVWIPEKRIGIEFNGDFWHSEQIRGKRYHLDKLNACQAVGISLIQVFEHEWDSKSEVVKDRLKSLLGLNQTKIPARKCKIVSVDIANERKFLEENHLQGYVPSSYRLGLEFNEELIMIMSVGKPRFGRTSDLELLRVSTKRGISAIGGASKLFKEICNRLQFNTLISYRDRRWGNSTFYQSLGFQLSHHSPPSYVYVKHGTVIPRYQAQKSKLKDLLGAKFNQDLTEEENMERSKFLKLWDCGQEVHKYIKF